MIDTNKIYQGDTLEVLKTFPSEFIDCVITSPPYWALRDYGVDGQLGLEKTPELYISKMVEVFSEIKRVLKKDGTVWLNIGDSYNSGSRSAAGSDKQLSNIGTINMPKCPKDVNLKEKDIVGIPWRLAFALQADGWYLRQDIIWSKPNPMPESCRDRCTKSHEYIFLLTKSQKYYYDNEAIREKANFDGRKDTKFKGADKYLNNMSVNPNGQINTMLSNGHERWVNSIDGFPARNKRSVWNVSTQPFKEAHFATFPLKLIEPMILAGTSEKGYCPECGKPMVREVVASGGALGKSFTKHDKDLQKGNSDHTSEYNAKSKDGTYKRVSIGFNPTCKCNSDFMPGLILDPFMGAGTVAVGALKHNRNFIGIELNPKYIEIAEKRIKPYLIEIKMF